MIFDDIKYGLLLLLLPVLVLRVLYLYTWKEKRKKTFAEEKFHNNIFNKNSTKKLISNNIFIISAFILIVLGLMDYLSGYEKKTVKREGIDIVFAIDLSKSMNAKDIVPSRLEKAKNIVVNTIDKLGGDRVGLVIFADDAFTLLPMTNDYQAVRTTLNNLETDLIASQGTNLETAISESALSLKTKNAASKVIIVLSDGEDHEGGKGNSVGIANDYNINIFSVGIGTRKGSPIPEVKKGIEIGYILDEEGNVVISKREDNVLTEIAEKTGGNYIYGDNTYETVNKLLSSFSNLKKNKMGETQTYDAKHHFQWFIGLALLLIVMLTFFNIKNEFNL